VPLNPQTAAINDLVLAARASAPPPTAGLMRESYAALIEATTTERVSTVEPIEVAGLPSLLLTPPVCDGGLLVWFHGGGWTINSPELSINETDRLATAARCRCVSVGYRLAPEHPFPAPQLDAIDATRWCLEHLGDLGDPAARVAVGGDSAGGNLAAVAAQRVAPLCAQLLVYPAVDLRVERRGGYEHAEGYALDAAAMDFFYAQSTGDTDLADPLVSPLLASSDVLSSVPPALIVSAEYDPLTAEGREYAAALRAAGVDVEVDHYDDEMHLFFSLPGVLDGSKRAIDRAGAFLAGRFAAG
jgi:acetyl esterase